MAADSENSSCGILSVKRIGRAERGSRFSRWEQSVTAGLLVWLLASLALHHRISRPGLSACACKSAKQYFNSDCCLRITVDGGNVGAIAYRLGDGSPGRFISELIQRQIQSLQCSTEPRRSTAPQHRALTQIRDEDCFSSSPSLSF